MTTLTTLVLKSNNLTGTIPPLNVNSATGAVGTM